MTDCTVVDEAAGWADWLVRREHRGPGDTVEAARLRAARKHKLPERLLWALRYRKPKRIWADVYVKLQEAVAAELERQERALAHDIELTKARRLSAAGWDAVAQAEAFLAAQDQPEARASAERT
jgi:hypothetical protein